MAGRSEHHRAGSAATVLTLVTVLFASGMASAQGFKWWTDESVQKRLVLSPEQSRRLEEVFQQALPSLRSGRLRLEAAEQELSALIEGSIDEAPVVRQLERVEAIRTDVNKTRTLMLLHMRRVLSADQRLRLDELHHERERDRRGPRGRTPNNR
ncbi:MAG: periplasmic heavy metal sensor [Vicinamibacterales bacterium]